nr:uncharacterized protein A4U43_C08F2320 [Ipomoea batatas]
MAFGSVAGFPSTTWLCPTRKFHTKGTSPISPSSNHMNLCRNAPDSELTTSGVSTLFLGCPQLYITMDDHSLMSPKYKKSQSTNIAHPSSDCLMGWISMGIEHLFRREWRQTSYAMSSRGSYPMKILNGFWEPLSESPPLPLLKLPETHSDVFLSTSKPLVCNTDDAITVQNPQLKPAIQTVKSQASVYPD